MLDLLFEIIMECIFIHNANDCMLFAKVVVWPYYHIFVVGIVPFIIGAAEEGVCVICSSGFVFQ